MILSTILGPPEAPPERKPPQSAERPQRVLSVTRERGRRYRRALAIGIILSVLVHLVAVVLSPLIVRYVESQTGLAPAPPPAAPRSEGGMHAVEIRVVEQPPVEEPAARPPRRPEREITPQPAAPAAEEAEPALSAAERLRPRVGDWRLWVTPPLPDERDPTRAERLAALEARIAAAIQAGDDSLAAQLEREAQAMDWTVGEEGNKWGITPGKLHLGPVTLPLPLLFEPHPATAREQADRAADWSAIQRQAGQAGIDQTFEERVKAIRERKAREEAEKAKKDTTSSGGG